MAVVWLVLIALGALAFGIWMLRCGLSEQSWFWALMGAREILGVIVFVLIAGVLPILFLLPPELTLAIVFIIVLSIWPTLAFLAFKHKDEWVGKALFFLTMVWSCVFSIPLMLFFRWQEIHAILAALGLSGAGLIAWGLIKKQARAAKARKEAFYKRVLDEADSREKPPWET